MTSLLDGPRVLGLDLAAECSGVALPDGSTLVIRAPRQADRRRRTLADDLARLDRVATVVEDLLDRWRPVLVVLEDYAPGIRSSAAHRLAEISGTVRRACWRAESALALVSPSQLKRYATGHGLASKQDMVDALAATGHPAPATHDETDAWWLWAMGRDYLGAPVADVGPARRAVLNRITLDSGALW